MIRFHCTCGKAYQLKDEMAGKRVKCPACQGVMTVPAAAALVETLEPLPSPSAAPLGGLAPLTGGNLFADLPSPGPLSLAPLGMPQQAPLSPGLGYAPLSAGPAAAIPARGSGIPAVVWVLAGVGGAAALLVVIVVVAIMVSLSGGNANIAKSPISPPPPSAPGASGTVVPGAGVPGAGQPLQGGSGMPQVNQPTVNRDWRGRESIGSDVGKWQSFESEEGGYKINLPGKPQIVPQSMDTPNGKVSGSLAVLGSDASGLVVVITHLDVPYDPAVVPFDKLAEMNIATQGGKIIRTGNVMVSGKPGKEFHVDINKNGFVGKGIFRTLGAGGRVFVLAYLSQTNRYDEAKATECLNSFVLTKEPPPPPAGNGQPFNAGIPIARDVEWTKFDSPEQRCRFELPAPGKRMEPKANGLAVTESWVCEVAGKGAFSVSVTSYLVPLPADKLPEAIERFKTELAKPFGQLTHQSTSQQGEVQVGDFVFNSPNSMRALVRGYFTPKLAYQLTWLGPPDGAGSEEVTRFFNSFVIVDAAEGASPPPKSP